MDYKRVILQEHSKRQAQKISLYVGSHPGRFNPDLIKELKIILEDNLPYTTPGFYSRAIKVIKELQ